jgi:hypothetical protein
LNVAASRPISSEDGGTESRWERSPFERPPGEEPAPGQGNHQGDRSGHDKDRQQTAQRLLDRMHGRPDLNDIDQDPCPPDRHGQQADRRLSPETGRFEGRAPFEGLFQRELAERNVQPPRVIGLDGDAAGRAEDLEKLVHDGQLGKIRTEILEWQRRPDPALLDREDGGPGCPLQRAVHLIAHPAGHHRVENDRKHHERHQQHGAVPERETDSQGQSVHHASGSARST